MVAPHVGAWIETVDGVKIKVHHVVAPHVGAWIETGRFVINPVQTKSHPTWVRGLKLAVLDIVSRSFPSHPTWVRGLKLFFLQFRPLSPCRTPRGCVD